MSTGFLARLREGKGFLSTMIDIQKSFFRKITQTLQASARRHSTVLAGEGFSIGNLFDAGLATTSLNYSEPSPRLVVFCSDALSIDSSVTWLE